jgi:polysaccharide pyruvyl transferase WcaK-like protein
MTKRRFFNIALLAAPSLGEGSFSTRMAKALESLGHGVFAFTPQTHPELFEENQANLIHLHAFLTNQHIDIVLCTDGLTVTEHDRKDLRDQGICFGCMGRHRPSQLEGDSPLTMRFDGWEGPGATEDALCLPIAPVSDGHYRRSTLANEIAYHPGLLCVQDATPERLRVLAALETALREQGHDEIPLRCFGKGWPIPWKQGEESTSFIYASRNSFAAIIFDEQGDLGCRLDDRLALPVSDGCVLLAFAPTVVPAHTVGTGNAADVAASSYYRALMHDAATQGQLAHEALAWGLRMGATTAERDSRIEHEDDMVFAQANATVAPPLLEDELATCLEKLLEHILEDGRYPKGFLRGMARPARTVCVMGWFGMGNLGDELVLDTLRAQTNARFEEASLVAVSMRPWHTLVNRGIYAIGYEDKRALDQVLARSSAALACAGLLFDQGIRWTSGKTEMLTRTAHPDIPGLAGFVALATMNATPVLFFGIGAGPLALDGSQRLVSLMGTMGTRFLARDTKTRELILACGVSPNQVQLTTDTAFLLEQPSKQTALAWGKAHDIDFETERVLLVCLRLYEGQPPDFMQRIAHALDAVVKVHEDVRILFISFDPEDDELHESTRMLLKATSQAVCFEATDDIDLTISILKASSLAFAMRFHCSLLMNSFDKPCVGIDYLPKVAALYEQMGTDDLLVPLDATTEEYQDALFKLFDGYQEYRETITSSAEVQRVRAREAREELFTLIANEREQQATSLYYLYDEPANKRHERAVTYQLEQECERLRQACAQEVEGFRRSYAYRIGRLVTYLPSKLRALLR